MSAEQFLKRLLDQGLLEPKVVASLRKQIASSKKKFTAKSVAKLLVSKGRLTQFQAKKALSEMAAEKPAADDSNIAEVSPAGDESKASGGSSKGHLTADDLEDELVPLDEEPEAELEPIEEELQPLEDELQPLEDELEPLEEELQPLEDELQPLEDDPPEATVEVTPDEPAAGGLQPLEEETLEPIGGVLTPPDSGLEPLEGGLEPLEGGLEPFDGGGLDPLTGGLEPMAGGLEPIDGGGLEPLGASGEPAAKPAEPAQATGAHVKKKAASRPWESALILIGGGTLVALLLISGVLYFVLTRGNAAEMFAAAEEAYSSGSYSNAKNHYSEFVSAFPSDENASLARVKMGLAELRISSGGANKTKALETAQEVMPRIKAEDKFSEGRTEVASILPDIAEGLAKSARNTEETELSEELTDKAENAMELVNEYVTGTVRKTQTARIAAIEELIALERREIRRNKRLVTDLGEMSAALEDKETKRAYEIRKQLLLEYPDLEGSEQLAAAVSDITSLQSDLVVSKVNPIDALTDDPTSAVSARVVLATTKGATADSAVGKQALFLVRGSCYGLDAATGKVLWRRSVGFATTSQPVRIGSDALLVNGSRNELMRVRAETGELIWRTPLGGPFGDPLVLGERAYVAVDNQRIVAIDVNTGAASNYADMPQLLSCSPGGDEKASKVYAVGDHSNLYVLSSTKLSSSEVFYLGHKEGTVRTPPVMLRGHLFVAENAGSNYSLMHVLSTDSTGGKIEAVQQPFRLTGRVIVPPVVVDRKMLVITDLGAITLFDFNLESRSQPVKIVAEFSQTSKKPILSYSAADTAALWIGDERLSKYGISTAKGTLESDWRKPIGDAYLAPLQLFGNALCIVRKQNNSASVIASALTAETGDEIWRTELASPFAGPPVKMGDQMVGVSSQGNLYSVPSDLEGQIQLAPTAVVQNVVNELSFNNQANLGGDQLSVTSRVSPGLGLFADAGGNPAKVTRVKLDIPDAAASAEPTMFGGGLLFPSPAGQVYLLDPKTGKQLKSPFQPPLAGGEEITWNRPVVVDTNAFFIADSRQLLHKVGPQMQGVAEAKLPFIPIGATAVLGDFVWQGVRGEEGDQLESFNASDLKPAASVPLGGPIAWGPVTVNDVLLAATHDEIVCVQADGAILWKQPTAQGIPVGEPLVEAGQLIFASSRGMVWRADAATGEASGDVDLNEPFMSGPARFGKRIAIAGADGVIHFLEYSATE